MKGRAVGALRADRCPMINLSPIPKTAPFAENEIELLNRVVGAATSTQRVWLAGFLAGVEASSAASPPTAPPVATEPLTIIYATESGNSEKLASDLGKAARRSGRLATVGNRLDAMLQAVKVRSAGQTCRVARQRERHPLGSRSPGYSQPEAMTCEGVRSVHMSRAECV
jgi:hypothetical protein